MGGRFRPELEKAMKRDDAAGRTGVSGFIISTTSTLQGWEIKEYLGVAAGVVSGMRGARSQWEGALESAVDQASQWGANALIGVGGYRDNGATVVTGTAVKAAAGASVAAKEASGA